MLAFQKVLLTHSGTDMTTYTDAIASKNVMIYFKGTFILLINRRLMISGFVRTEGIFSPEKYFIYFYDKLIYDSPESFLT